MGDMCRMKWNYLWRCITGDFGGILSEDGGLDIDGASDNEDNCDKEASHELSLEESENGDDTG